MKVLIVSLLAAASLLAQDFTTGQAARIVIGQPTFTAQNPVSSDTVVGGVGGMALVNGHLLVTDANRVGALGFTGNGAATDQLNHRVLIFKDLLSSLPGINDPFPQPAGPVRCPACLGQANVVLGQTDFKKFEFGRGRSGLRLPTAVASDGTRVAVADTDNNRVLIWNRFPTSNSQPADVVLGQTDFDRAVAAISQTAMRGPQGVWIQGNRLFVADTQNNRILIWNSIPTSNNQGADLVLGQPDFNSGFTRDLQDPQPTVNNLLNPVSVTSDGQRLYVADLGHNRVLIWNSIPSRSQTPPDTVLGQPSFTEARGNNSPKLCASNGKDDKGNDTFPVRCARTMDFPRFVVSDGRRLYVADAGNDRVLVWNSIPNQNNVAPDAILGQPDEFSNFIGDFERPERSAAVDALRTPLALATDGRNLFVSDSFNRRILVFSVGRDYLPLAATTNAASRQISSIGWFTLTGEAKKDDEIELKLGDFDDDDRRVIKYKVVEGDTLATIGRKLTGLINEGDGDPFLIANFNEPGRTVVMVARKPGEDGDDLTFALNVARPSGDTTPVGVTFTQQAFFGGRDAARLGPGTIVQIRGEQLSGGTASAPLDRDLPLELADTQVFIDGIQVPLTYVSPQQINAQLPFEISDGATSSNLVVRTKRPNGQWEVSRAIPVNITTHNPGLFALEGDEPRPGVAFHASNRAATTIALEGTRTNIPKDIKVKVTLGEGDAARSYNYTTIAADSLRNVRDALIQAINDDVDAEVFAFAGGAFERVIIRSKKLGKDGEGLAIAGNVDFTGSTAGSAESLSVNIYGDPKLCCAGPFEFAPVTEQDPAVPGEMIWVIATGLGLTTDLDSRDLLRTGKPYPASGPVGNPLEFVNSVTAGNVTAQVLTATPRPGAVGLYNVLLQLAPNLPTNPRTILWIGQGFTISNQVTIPVTAPVVE
jgi:uncharacterized protein (TIGR03437 family)